MPAMKIKAIFWIFLFWKSLTFLCTFLRPVWHKILSWGGRICHWFKGFQNSSGDGGECHLQPVVWRMASRTRDWLKPGGLAIVNNNTSNIGMQLQLLCASCSCSRRS